MNEKIHKKEYVLKDDGYRSINIYRFKWKFLDVIGNMWGHYVYTLFVVVISLTVPLLYIWKTEMNSLVILIAMLIYYSMVLIICYKLIILNAIKDGVYIVLDESTI